MSSSGTSVPTLSSGAVPELGFAVGASCAAKSAVALVLLRHGRNRGLVVCSLGWVRRGTASWGELGCSSLCSPGLILAVPPAQPLRQLNSSSLRVQFQLEAGAVVLRASRVLRNG